MPSTRPYVARHLPHGNGRAQEEALNRIRRWPVFALQYSTPDLDCDVFSDDSIGSIRDSGRVTGYSEVGEPSRHIRTNVAATRPDQTGGWIPNTDTLPYRGTRLVAVTQR